MGLTTKEIGSSSFNDMISSVDRRSEYVENRAGANVRLNNFLTPYTLDNKSSILNAPCGYSNGVYPSLRPVGGENILLQSNQFDTTWVLNNGATLTSGQTGYDGSTDAWLLTKPANGFTNAAQSISTSGIVTFSVYAKAGTISTFNLRMIGTDEDVLFDLSAGSVSTSTSGVIDSKITAISSGWYRCSFSAIYGSGTQIGIYVCDVPDANAGNIYIQDAQLEKGYRATPYTETTTSPAINADFDFSRGSSATRVNEKGLIEDVQILSGNLVQNGDFEQIGSEEITNGDFSSTDISMITGAGTRSVVNGELKIEESGVAFSQVIYNGILDASKTYKAPFALTLGTGIYNVYGTTQGLVRIYSSGSYTFYLKSTERFYVGSNGVGDVWYMDNVSVKEVGQNWSFFGEAEFTANGARIYSSSGGQSYINQPILTNTKKYRISYEIIDSTQGSLKLINVNGLSDYPIPSTVGTHTLDFTANNPTLFIYRNSGATDVTIDNISVKEVTDDTDIPRIDYTSGQGALLLEPQSTNLITYSEDLSVSYWTKSNVTTTPNAAVSPDGTQNASEIVGTTSSNFTRAVNVAVGNGDTTMSCYVKSNDGVERDFKFGAGSLGASKNGTFTATSEWQRIEFTINTTAQSTDFGFFNSNGNQLNMYVWGVQLEAGSYATSYIPTAGSTVTRSADVANNSGKADLFNDSEGVLYAEFSALADDLTRRIITITDGTLNNIVKLEYKNISNQIEAVLYNGNTECLILHTLLDETEFNKIAFKYKQDDFSLFVNGIEVGADTSGVVFSQNTLNNLSF